MPHPRAIDIAEQLDAIAEQLADLALDCLREALDAAEREDDGTAGPDRGKVAEERILTRARRSVEKAAFLLRSGELQPADS